MFEFCTGDIYWSKHANQLAPSRSKAAASAINTNTPLVSKLPVWIAGCMANWADKLSAATGGSRLRLLWCLFLIQVHNLFWATTRIDSHAFSTKKPASVVSFCSV